MFHFQIFPWRTGNSHLMGKTGWTFLLTVNGLVSQLFQNKSKEKEL